MAGIRRSTRKAGTRAIRGRYLESFAISTKLKKRIMWLDCEFYVTDQLSGAVLIFCTNLCTWQMTRVAVEVEVDTVELYIAC